MELLTVLTIVAVGLAVGVLAGVVGIGGGVLIVPFLYFFYDHPEIFGFLVAEETRTVLAHGTSLFVILPTSLLGTMAYHRNGLVEWRATWPVGVVSIVGAMVGTQLALQLSEEALKIAFGALLMVSGVHLGVQRKPGERRPEERRINLAAASGVGLTIGIFSSLLGVGGGVIAIPLLMHVMKLPVRKLAATSIGIVSITAAAGTASYMWSGYGTPGLPEWSIGYVHLSAGVAMFLGSVATVRWGARLNQRLKPRTLTIVFVIIFVLFGARLILENVWDLLGLGASGGAVAAGVG